VKGYDIITMRKKHGKMTQMELAKELGISDVRLRRLENRDEVPKFEALAVEYFFIKKANQSAFPR
jgi:transcriptional regulator with XRE-family HTH domain